MNFKIPNNIQKVLDILHENNFEAYLVGGCVRDFLMGNVPKDYDITTNALPEQIKAVFNNYKLINNNGEKHGTVTVFIDEPIEITTYRIETDYKDHRHPDEVIFVDSLYQDLSRRDFTINAIAFDGKEIVDPFSGQESIRNKEIICVGNPSDRFSEDALRILRGIRFAVRYNYEIEKNTLKAMNDKSSLLQYISKERIKSELDKIIIEEGFINLFKSHKLDEILLQIIPELEPMIDFDQKSKYHKNNLWNHTASVVSHVKKESILKLSALFHDIGKPSCYTEEVDKDGILRRHFVGHPEISYKITKEILERLKYSNEEKEKILFLVQNHDFVFSDINPKKSVKKLLQIIPENYRDELFYKLLNLRNADQVDHIYYEPILNLNIIREAYENILSEEKVFDRRHLLINGYDLLNLGYSGPILKVILNDCVEKIIDEELENTKECILEYVKNNYKHDKI